MKTLTKQELLQIEGGAFSASMLSAIVRGINSIAELGRNVGTAIRRLVSGSVCRI